MAASDENIAARLGGFYANGARRESACADGSPCLHGAARL